jgi:hypothetical protein
MIFIIRTEAGRTTIPPGEIKMIRQTPAIVPDSTGRVDFFCFGDPEAASAAGLPVVPVHDGWYADDNGGGMAIWGQGVFWEVRGTPFTIKQACGPEAKPPDPKIARNADLNVRQAIYQG